SRCYAPAAPCAADWRNECNRDTKSATRSWIRSSAPPQPFAPTGWPLPEPPRCDQTGSAQAQSPVDLSEYDVERTEDGRDVGQQVPLADEVHRLQMGKTRRANVALVGLVGAVGDQIDAEFALRRFYRGIDLAGRHVEALGVELEMMDQRFHRALHLAAARREDLVILDSDRPLPVGRPQLGDALPHDAHRLPHLFHANTITV